MRKEGAQLHPKCRGTPEGLGRQAKRRRRHDRRGSRPPDDAAARRVLVPGEGAGSQGLASLGHGISIVRVSDAGPRFAGCWIVTGEHDFFLDLRARDMDAFSDVMLNRVVATVSVFVLADVKPPLNAQRWDGT